MDIARLSMGMSQVSTQNDVGVAVLSKAIQSNETQGQKMVQMMNESVARQTGVGSLFDAKI